MRLLEYINLISLLIIIIVFLYFIYKDYKKKPKVIRELILFPDINEQRKQQPTNYNLYNYKNRKVQNYEFDTITFVNRNIVNNYVNDDINAENDIIMNIIANNLQEEEQLIDQQNRGIWINDKQNVHDSNVNKEIVTFYNKLCDKNIQEKSDNIEWKDVLTMFKDYTDVTTFLHEIPDLSNVQGVLEKDYIIEITKRINSPTNYKNKNDMINAFRETVKDCYEPLLVCSTGRITHLISSLAGFEDDVGIFRTKVALRQEFLNKCSASVQEYLKTLSKEDFDSYINDTDSNRTVDELKNIIIKISEEYKDRFSDHEIQNMINEANQAI